MYSIEELLKATIEMKASDLHLTTGLTPILRIDGKLNKHGSEILLPEDIKSLVSTLLTEQQMSKYCDLGEIDFSYALDSVGRFRINAFKQRGVDTLAIRAISLKIPTLEELYMPSILKELCKKQRGLVLLTGPTGSGKSTTLAAMINEMNQNRSCHIITLEEPIEYLHQHGKCMVNQREVGLDTTSFHKALRAALREDPDVILVGEMRDLETISIAVTAAETGHLVLSTLHTVGASNTLDRIVDVFPPHQQQQIKVQLSAVIEGVISQQLLPIADGSGRVAALEVMTGTPAIRNLIREGKTHQIDSVIQTSSKSGMRSMDMSLAQLYKDGILSYQEVVSHCVDRDILNRLISQ